MIHREHGVCSDMVLTAMDERREYWGSAVAGLLILLNTLQLLSEYTPEEMTQLAAGALSHITRRLSMLVNQYLIIM